MIYNRTNKKLSTKALLLLAFSAVLFTAAPAAQGQNISFRGGASKLLYDGRHFPDLYGEGIAPTIPSFTAKIGWQDFSSSPFASFCKHPELGLAFQVDALEAFNTGKSPGIGNIYSLYGYFDRPVITAGAFSMEYTAGLGLGFCFNHLYHPAQNPANFSLSAPVNARIMLGLQAKYSLSKRFFVGAGAYFNHTSNGAVSFPNRGVNAFEFSLIAGMKNKRETASLPESADDVFRRKVIIDLQFSGGVMSNEAYYDYKLEKEGIWENKSHFKYAFSARGLYQYCRMHATGLGVDVFVTPFCDEIAKWDGRGVKYDPVSVGISVMHEMRYRDLALIVGVGRYLYDNDGLARNKKLYQLVSMRYHFPALAKCYAGLVLKAHKFMAAECFQVCIGKVF